jgi:hypothetical protein
VAPIPSSSVSPGGCGELSHKELPALAGEDTPSAEVPSLPALAASSFVLLSSGNLEFPLLLWFTSKFSAGIANFSSVSKQI